VRVVVADDSLLVREGIVSLLRRAGFDVVAEASTGDELVGAVDTHVPDVAIIDIRMPPTHTEEGLTAAHEIRSRHPDIGVVILSQHVEVGIAMRLLAETPAGLGYLLKRRGAEPEQEQPGRDRQQAREVSPDGPTSWAYYRPSIPATTAAMPTGHSAPGSQELDLTGRSSHRCGRRGAPTGAAAGGTGGGRCWRSSARSASSWSASSATATAAPTWRAPSCRRTSSASRTRTSPSPPATGSSSRAGTSRPRTARPSSRSRGAAARSGSADARPPRLRRPAGRPPRRGRARGHAERVRRGAATGTFKAAIDFLQRRPDVDPNRIGGIGLSVGGEMMLETAAESEELAAVVSEGAGARTTSEGLDHEDRTPVRQGRRRAARRDHADLGRRPRTRRRPPTSSTWSAGSRRARCCLIAAPNSPNGEDLNRGSYRAAQGPKELWEIPGSRHLGGIAARPQEYERRVIGFFDRALLD
jgi:CheY-like chemotaxis protein